MQANGKEGMPTSYAPLAPLVKNKISPAILITLCSNGIKQTSFCTVCPEQRGCERGPFQIIASIQELFCLFHPNRVSGFRFFTLSIGEHGSDGTNIGGANFGMSGKTA
jgi:hypothetical protein